MISKLTHLRNQITEACARSNRNSKDITLVCVVKKQSLSKIEEALTLGETHLGENYAQEFLSHQKALSEKNIHWHFIGHLQRNKVKQILPQVTLIHSVDSWELAQEINKQAQKINKRQNLLIEINLGEETSKTGLPKSEALHLVEKMNSLEGVILKGLMVMPPFFEDSHQARPFFSELRKIRDEINQKSLYRTPLTELSMGMTHDFEIAIEEGATLLRIGTGIFGEREK